MHRYLFVNLALCALLASCAARREGAETFGSRVTLQPAAEKASTPHDSTASQTLPQLPVSHVSTAQQTPRIDRIEAVNEDLRTVLQGLAESLGLGHQLDPEVKGSVNVRLTSVTLDDALRAIVAPHGLSYSVQGGVLRVGPTRVETRIFTLDYVALSRFGTGSTVIQRRLGSVGGAGIQGGGQQQLGGGGSDVITSVAAADLWEEIRVAVEALVFDQPGTVQQAAQVQQQPGFGGGLRTGGPFSRVSEDGRKLIINPVAGTILVNAPPLTLAQVDAFIKTFEASVQRQVLIEAKIVEVTLDRSAEFGIDWSAVQRLGGVDLRVGSQVPAQGGVQFQLQGGTQQITVVLRALSEQGDVRVLSSPQVSALNNQRAIFDVTTDEIVFNVTRQPILGPTGGTIGFNTQIQPQQIGVGIVLDVLPQVAPDNTVSMNIRPVVTSVARVESIELEDGSQARAPVIDRRQIDTMARVRDGETIVIGGLIQTRRTRTRTGIPFLKDLPVLGYVFGKTVEAEHKGELVIFLTPSIITGQPPTR
ncbi:MAG: secretin and TonB N-terminal domain-containing protein [Gemmatimonadota bacterium]